MTFLQHCRVIAPLFAAALLVACGGGATSGAIGAPGGGAAQNGNANLQALALACDNPEVACGPMRLIPPEGLPQGGVPDGFLPGAVFEGTPLGDYGSTQSALVAAVTLTPTVVNPRATVTVNGVPVASGAPGPALALAPGATTEVEVVVTAVDGVTRRTYSLAVTRLSPDNADLASLTLSAGALEPVFAPGETAYVTELAYTAGGVRVTAIPADPAATVAVAGQIIAEGESDPVDLPAVGENDPIDILVTAISGVTKTYRITATRFGSPDLAALSVTGLVEEEEGVPILEVPMSLAPAFQANAARNTYGSRAEFRVNAVEVTATALAPGAEIRIGGQVLTSGEPSAPIALDNVGEGEDDLNVITIDVEHAESGTDDPFTRTYRLEVVRQEPPRFVAEAYLKPSVPASLAFGSSLALSADGTVAVVGAPGEPAPAPVDGNDAEGGAAYVYRLVGDTWQATDRLRPDDVLPGDRFGTSVALSADANLLAIGAPAVGFSEPLSPEPGFDREGAVYVYTRDGGSWGAPEVLRSLRQGGFDGFGFSVSLGALDGVPVLAVGAPEDGGDEAGIQDPAEFPEDAEGAAGSGAAYVFTRDAGAWVAQAVIKHDEPGADATRWLGGLGASVALSADGTALAVGMPSESSSAQGINNAVPGTNTPGGSGAVFVYARDGGGWGGPDHFKSQVPQGGHLFGTSVALSADGRTLAVGEPNQGTASQGAWDTRADDLATNAIVPAQFPSPRAAASGAVYIFSLEDDDSWLQQAFIKASNSRAGFRFGTGIALTADGDRLIVGAPGENSAATTIDGDQISTGAAASGAAYALRREDGVWTHTGYLKAPNSRSGIGLGASVGIAGGGALDLLAAGADAEGSVSVEVVMHRDETFPTDNDARGRGAAFLFRAEPEPEPEPEP